MKKTRWIASLVALVMATAAFAAAPKFPSYLIMDGTTVAGVKNQKKLPADLVIPEGATVIGWAAFKDCASLVSVRIGEGVTKIGYYAFDGCTSLASVTISESVTTIEDSAFRNCTSLASVTIPASMTAIGYDAFKSCTSLKEVQFGGTIAQWKAIQGSGNVYVSSILCSDGYIGVKEVPEYLKMSGTKVTECIGKVLDNLVIPDGVTEIGNYAFLNCTLLASVTIPVTVTAIGDYAFMGCKSLKGVTIPEGVTKIGRGAFQDCASLASITIPASVTAIGDDVFKGCTSLKEIQFKGTTAQWEAIQRNDAIPIAVRCSDGNVAAEVVPNLKMEGTVVTGYTGTLPAKLVIPRGVTKIGSYAFDGCTSLASVTIPASVTEIRYYAFNGCTSLAIVTIPASVKEIGSDAFNGCSSLKEIQYKGTKAQWEAIQGNNNVNAPYISFTDGYIGVKDVPAYLKMSGTEVTGYTGKVPANLVIPDGVTEIGSRAFNGCLDIESLTIPGSVKKIDDGYGSTPNGYGTFSDCTYLERVTILDGLLKIPVAIFYNCTSLASVTIPSSVTSIGWVAFWNCAALKNVNIPSSVTEIGSSAFEGCTSLASVRIPGSVTEIDSSAFKGCTSLASVTIAEGVTSIGGGAFSGCAALKNVVIPASVTGIYTTELPPYNDTVYLGAFEGCTSLASVTIPNSVTEIYAHTFKGCASLRSVTIPRGVTSIDYKAFDGCTSLASVIIPRSVTEIGQNAFSKCSPNLKVQYDGTKAQWGAISKGKNYYFPTIGSFVVQCTDGVVTEK